MKRCVKRLYAVAGVCGARYEDIEMLMVQDKRLQFIDPGIVFGRDHIESAILHAVRAFMRGKNTCREMRAEVLLYLSGERQISTAIKVAGVKKGEDRCVMLILNPKKGEPDSIIRKMHWKRDDTLISPAGKDPSKLKISKTEACSSEMIEDLVLERVALVDVIKRG